MSFGASAIFFVSPLPHQQNISLWGHFSSKETTKQKKVAWDATGWIGRVRYGGHAIFGQKLLNTQCSVGRCARKSPIMKWANALKESSKNSLMLNTASHNNASWCTDTDGFLEYSPSRGSLYYKGPALQKIICFCFWSLLVIIYNGFHRVEIVHWCVDFN